MGRASRSKRPSEREEARREEQSRKASGPVQQIFNAQTDYRIKYDIQLPGGVFRGPFPTQKAGQVVAGTEPDIARAFIFELISCFGYANVGRAVSGIFAETINPLSMGLRNMILMQLAQGTGLDIIVEDITSCAHCGAEQETVDILDPNAPDGEQMEQQDTTVHKLDCKAEADPPSPEWRTGPAVRINHPQRYPAVFAPQETIEAGREDEEAETKPIEGDTDRPLQFPNIPSREELS